MRFAGRYYNTLNKYSLDEVCMRVLWYLPENLIDGMLFEDVIVPSSKPHKESTL
jgi:hypothetical protein